MSRIRWFGWLGVGVLTSVLTVFALHPTVHGSSDAPLLAQRIALGKQLFNDPSLSADGTVRCASCHIPEKGVCQWYLGKIFIGQSIDGEPASDFSAIHKAFRECSIIEELITST
ncbi:cytochrome c peroxidase [Burkholderia pseudomallei]|uniref:cytochrome c peroxidase n=1 Tax=Burkholderia pseudomallei TaxID=28450 RepID=UPI00017229BC|nr:cytochrome c peroxidase [Burkholderia pseudomallei]EDS87829.1 cytochrome-c peroxidase [Burkholderia pseudomallei S13]